VNRSPSGRLVAGLLVVSALLAAGGIFLTARSGYLLHPVWFGVQRADLVLGSVVVGIYWWRRRSASLFGPALIAYGLLAAVLFLEAVSSPALRTMASVYDGLLLLFTFALVLGFPGMRLRDRGTRIALSFVLFGVILAATTRLLYAESIFTGSLARCNERGCPQNPFQVTSDPDLLSHLQKVAIGFIIAGTVTTAVVLARRLRGAGSHQRRSYAVGTGVGAIFVLTYLAYATLMITDSQRLPGVNSSLQWTMAITRGLLPWGYLVALFTAELVAGRVLASLVAATIENHTTVDLQRAFGAVLDDSSLRLGVWNPEQRAFIDPEGNPVSLDATDARVDLIQVVRDDGTAAAIVHRTELASEPELTKAAAAGALLALDNARLDRELRATVDELRESRKRLVSAGDAERQRLERDLHDGAQQRLIAVRVKLGLARELVPPGGELSQRFDELEGAVDASLRELRELAHGIYPTILATEGLRGALRSAAARSDLAVSIDTDVGRCPLEIESAVYFCCLEALQNAAKHAGPDARVSIVVRELDDEVAFSIADDGRGFDPSVVPRGQGLQNLDDRIVALGGRLDVSSEPGAGVTVWGRVPLHGRDARAGAATSDPLESVSVSNRPEPDA
jgi:signal transduction histidine kinase